MTQATNKTSRFERTTDLMLTVMQAAQPVTMTELVNSIPGYPVGAPEDTLRAAFERDKRILRESGVSVVAAGPDGKPAAQYRFEESEIATTELELSGEERKLLTLALALFVQEGAAAQSAVAKLSDRESPFGQHQSAWILQLARRAVTSHRPLRFTYRGRTVDIEPYGVVEFNGEWVVVGRDKHREGCKVRGYRLSLLADLPVIGRAGAFELPAIFDPATTFVAESDDELLPEESECLAAVANRAIDSCDRTRRLLAFFDCLNRFGSVDTAQFARIFQMRTPDLIHELETLACCGVAPFTPDLLLSIVVDEQEIVVDGLERFARDGHLTTEEARAALEAGYCLVEMTETTPLALKSAIGKLERLLDDAPVSHPITLQSTPQPVGWSTLVTLHVAELHPVLERVMVGEPTELKDGGRAVVTFLADRRWRRVLLDTLGGRAALEAQDSDDETISHGERRAA